MAQPAVQHPMILTSWKEIASYLGKGVRTVQRWELEFDLPVRRPDSRSKGIVHASTEELDQWLANRWKPRGSDGASRGPKPAPFPPLIEHIARSQELRGRQRLLLKDLAFTMGRIQRECESMTSQLQVSAPLRPKA